MYTHTYIHTYSAPSPSRTPANQARRGHWRSQRLVVSWPRYRHGHRHLCASCCSRACCALDQGSACWSHSLGQCLAAYFVRCVCVYMSGVCVCIYTYIHTYIHIDVHVYMCALSQGSACWSHSLRQCLATYFVSFVCVYMCVCVFVHISICAYTLMWTGIAVEAIQNPAVLAYMHAYIHTGIALGAMQVLTYIYAYIHTYIQA